MFALAGLAYLPSGARAQPVCQVEEAQRLFGQQPRPTAEAERLLAACQAGGSTDYRVYTFLGVIARDRGDGEQAVAYLRKAHELAPREPSPALELGFTLETRRPGEARQVYEQVLANDPASRPAMLGLARVARSQNRLGEARALYQRLLAADPKDAEALNGMAWLAMAHRDRRQTRAGFEQVLAIDPGNAEARTGLSKTPDVYRYLLEVSAIAVSTDLGTSQGFQARGLAGVSALDTLELGWRHYSDELPTLSNNGLSTLPSNDVTVGYHRLAPLSYAVSLVYDYRDRDGEPAEHWVDGSLDLYVTDRLQWFVGYRQAFGDVQYDGRLIRTGLRATLAPDWQVTGTVYDSAQASFNDYEDLWSWVVDVTYYGPRNMLLVVGGGASPSIDNVDLHARAILPVADRIAVQLIAAHNSANAEASVTGGLVVTW